MIIVYRTTPAHQNPVQQGNNSVEAYALVAHGVPRATGDLDVWVRRTHENAERALRALEAFGAPMHDLTADDFLTPDLVFQIGVEPNRIDILSSIDGVEFDEAWPHRSVAHTDDMECPLSVSES